MAIITGLDLIAMQALIDQEIPTNGNGQVQAINARTVLNKMAETIYAAASFSIIAYKQNDPPSSGIQNGDTYIVGPIPTGAWAGSEDKIAIYNNSAWSFLEPSEGIQAIKKSIPDNPYQYQGTYPAGQWVTIQPTANFYIYNEVQTQDGDLTINLTSDTIEKLYKVERDGIPVPKAIRDTIQINTPNPGDVLIEEVQVNEELYIQFKKQI